MNKEEFFISGFKSNFIGDDGAYVNGYVYSKDMFCEDIHFKREWLNPYDIAKKSMLVNISDAVAMNASPKFALIGAVLPESISVSDLKSVYKAFEEISKKYSLEIIGGDTVSGKRFCFSITIVSESKKPIFRKGLKEGHLLAYSGDLGSVGKELKRLLRGGKSVKNGKFREPRIRDGFMKEASKYIVSALDISDGLSKDLSRLCKQNGVGVKFFKKLSKELLCSAEEYELLFGFDRRYLSKLESIAKKHRIKINPFGKVVRGRYKQVCKENHF